MAIALATGLIGAAASGYGAYSASQGRKDQEAYLGEISEQIGPLEENIAGLFGEQEEASDPVATLTAFLQQYPDLLKSILPSLGSSAIRSSARMTQANVRSYQDALAALSPEFTRLKQSQVAVLDEMNPANLGQEELLAITRKLSPLIPAGTLDPKTGAVAGGTTSPVSLYRNLISGEYQQRRGDYFNAVSGYLTNAENSAYRQQEKAGDYLTNFLNQGLSLGNSMAGMTLESDKLDMAQNQFNIGTNMSLLQSLMGLAGGASNTAAYDAAISKGITGAASALTSALAESKYGNSGGKVINIKLSQ